MGFPRRLFCTLKYKTVIVIYKVLNNNPPIILNVIPRENGKVVFRIPVEEDAFDNRKDHRNKEPER